MKSHLIFKIIFFLFIFSSFLYGQQDPEGELDYFYITCGLNGYPGSGIAEVCFQLRFHSDNTGINKIAIMGATLIITGNNLVSIDTTFSKAFAGSAVINWEFSGGDLDVYKFVNQDPTVAPFHMYYQAYTFTSGDVVTGDSLLANICLTVNDTGTICIDTISTETLGNVFSIFAAVQYYAAGWSGPFCCQVVPCAGRAGDANSDGKLNLIDIVYNVNYVFKGGPAPSTLCQGDSNGDSMVNLFDIIYETNYVYRGGPAPVTKDPCC